MANNPRLTVVPSSTTASAPPRKLADPGLKLWRSITSEYDISDAGGIETLLQICEASDRLEGVTEQIKAEGLTVRTKAGPKEHPLLKTELALRSFIVRGLQRLGINIEALQPGVGRPGSGVGVHWKELHNDD